MSTKKAKKPTTKKAARDRRPATPAPIQAAPTHETPIVSTPEVQPVPPPVTATTEPAPVLTVKPRPMARTHRRLASPAQQRGADLVRYLRIHAKKPFGRRGEEAIRQLAVEVGHLGNLELNAHN